MKYLFEISKEHKSFPRSEIICCLKSENIENDIIEENSNILIFEIKDNKKLNSIFSRLSFTFFVDKFLFSCQPNIKNIKKNAEVAKINLKGSIAIKYKNRSKNIDSQKVVRTLASVLTQDKKVDLRNPKNEIRALITDSKVYIGLKLFEIDRSQYEKRKVQYRPFFSPISLHPKIARALVNISCIKENHILLDPFCGTGGFLIEAGLIGARVIGSDVEEKMIEGCKKTLSRYNIKNYNLYSLDIGSINKYVNNVDAVVTDLPYGKSTTTRGENRTDLYERSFKAISQVLNNNGKAVIGLPDKNLILIGKKYMKLVEIHKFVAHKSLTRFFAVFQNNHKSYTIYCNPYLL